MPERYVREITHFGVRAKMHSLSKAEEIGQLVKVRCGYCNVTHFYRAGDIAQLVGDVSVLEIEGNFRCSRCGKKDAMTATLVLPSAAEREKMTVRHLVTIKNVRVPVWHDVRG
ncbi:hypothetical protein [Rhizobium sp. GN54]|uniref:hypothetical protein n=1 Tax=Rhizobium sp. GN54 TaxID=2898150 RepID=UPI001E4468D3|nr:hypothetical protein [Rhizobium sp. GN54]MCD2184742.1 hypothetical protein [Rhizobium sp. GN54]